MIRDEFGAPEILESEVVYHGLVWDVVRETFRLPESSEPITRDFVEHPGAVAIAAVDEHARIMLIQQYRHPIRAREWEIPAGLLDVSGEPPHRTAARELAEEVDLEAATWNVLADQLSSPGGISETLRIYLARDITARSDAFERDDEESGIVPRWVPLAEAKAAVVEGRITNATAALGILHADLALARGFTDLRPADAPWSAREVPAAPGA